MRRPEFPAILATLGLLAACGGGAVAPPAWTIGPDPALPAPERRALPVINIAPAAGWPAGAAPVAAEGLAVQAFHAGLAHPRWIEVLANGDVLVAETNRQPAPPTSLRGFAETQVMRIAGAEALSADRISLLRDADGDGVAEGRSVLIDGLTSPFGMAVLGDHLYIADTDALLRVPFRPGETRIAAVPEIVARLPAGPPNRHWTKGLIAHGGRLYVSVGSNSDHGENGRAAEAGRAAIWQVDPETGAAAIHASGLRNPVGLDVEPETGALWAVVNERDELGDNLVPDYLTQVAAGDAFGWPWLYWGDTRDPRVGWPGGPETARRPDYALGPHVAPLGLAFAEGARLGERFREGAFIGRHGSWNRRPASGYDVVFVPFAGGRPAGPPRPVLEGFRTEGGVARGRPVGVAVAGDGALLVADDVGNTVWRVSRAAADARP